MMALQSCLQTLSNHLLYFWMGAAQWGEGAVAEGVAGVVQLGVVGRELVFLISDGFWLGEEVLGGPAWEVEGDRDKGSMGEG